MKKKIFSAMLLLVALVAGVVAYAGADTWDGVSMTEPQKNTDGAYLITNGAELAWCAAESNKAASSFNLVIANDIDLGNKQWTPIGQKQYFNGSIEGNGHTIKGLFMSPDATATCVGLVGKTNSASSYIKNLSIEGVINVAEVYTSSQCDIGSLIGLANAIGTVDNCHSKVNISVTANGRAANYMGGLIGRAKAMKLLRSSYGGVLSIGNDVTFNKGWGGVVGTFNSTVEGATTTMDNCWFDGKVNNTAAKAPSYGAALVGFPALTKGSFSMHNCYTAGTFNTNSDKGIIFTTFNTPTMNVGNNYAIDYTIEDANAIHLTKEQGENGELCWLLNGDQTKRVFGQNLSTDVMPLLIEDSKAVNRIFFKVDTEGYDSLYMNDTVILPSVNPTKEEYTFAGWYDAETEGNEVKAGSTIVGDMTLYARFTENPKDIWDGVTLTAITPDESGVYHVTTGAELAWVASESNKDIITWNIVLDNSIYLGNHAWTPIGQDKAFNGVFDGQGYTIN
ncbi:MAG: InlB B-repeat-containing protein, partial [Prevotella sp.]|nr:InlB B-repeat-containing protein [Candidatus Equicola stercoris]